MTAAHFFLDDVAGDRLRISGDDGRHAARVLRLRPGEEITVGDGRGTVVRARVSTIADAAVDAEVTDRMRVPAQMPRLTVCPAVPHSGKLDLVTQKLTELGVDAIVPWVAARSVPRWGRQKAARQGARLRAIAYEAAKQARRPWLPEVLDPDALQPPAGAAVVLHETADRSLRDVLPDDCDALTMVTGPEGGLTPQEVEQLRARGAVVATLGPLVLRTETAAIAGAVLVLGRYGRIG